MGLFPNLQSPKVDNELLSTRRLLMLYQYFCADKGYKFINDVIWTNTKLVQAAFLPTYPNAKLWSNMYLVQIQTVNPTAAADQHNVCPVVTAMQEKSYVFDPNL